MGSTWQTSENVKVKGPMGRKIKTPFYIQFVPGVVVDVVTSSESLHYIDRRTINSIMAIPHITEDLFQRKATVSEKNRYIPLFRGMVDVPAHGDPVMLCTIGGIQYYLGPLNTDNNPNWNDDNLYNPEINLAKTKISNQENRLKKGESMNFEKTLQYRLEKRINFHLDKVNEDDEDYRIGELHGDMVFEGRHGNSIRLGSRLKSPYVYISNGRNPVNSLERPLDQNLISMTSYGNFIEHFGDIYYDPNGNLSPSGYILSSDIIPEQKRYVSDMVKFTNGGDLAPEDILYNYRDAQTLISSERIFIDAKTSDLFLSSYRDTHIGAGRSLTITTEKDLIIESQGVHIGSGHKTTKEQEPMVLGNKLYEVLTELVVCLKAANFTTPVGSPMPLHDNMFTPLMTDNPKLQRKGLQTISGKLADILSNYHYIEPNEELTK